MKKISLIIMISVILFIFIFSVFLSVIVSNYYIDTRIEKKLIKYDLIKKEREFGTND